MEKTPGGPAFQAVPGYPLHRIRTPVSAHIAENLGRVGEQMPQEHRDTVQAIVLGGHNVGPAESVPVERRVQHRLHEIAVGPPVRPLALPLEPGADRVVPMGLLAEALLRQLRIPVHQILGDESHFHRLIPFGLLPFGVAAQFRGVGIHADVQILLHPGAGAAIFLRIVDFIPDAPGDFTHVHVFITHSQIILEETLIHDASGNPHGHRTDGKIALAPHAGEGQPRPGESENLLANIIGNRSIVQILDIPAVDAEGGNPLLGVAREHRREIHRPGALGTVESPHRLGRKGVHVHGFRTVAPAGCYREGNTHARRLELGRAGGGLRRTSDTAVGDNALRRTAVHVLQSTGNQFSGGAGHAHRPLFQTLAHPAEAPVDGGTNTDFRSASGIAPFTDSCRVKSHSYSS